MTQTRTIGPDALRRDEARERGALISNPVYTVAVDLTHGDETFGCDATIEFECAQPGAATFVDLMAPEVHRIDLNGREVPLSAFTGYRIALEGLERRNTLHVSATCAYSRTGTGLHFFRDPVDGNPYLHTQFEEREAHKVFPSFDQPSIKGTFAFTVTAPVGWVVVSNTAPSSRPAEDAAGQWVFPRTARMSSYITALVAGPYHSVHDRHGDVDLGIYCRRSLARYLDPEEIFEVTKQGLDFFTDYFDYPYVFGKYDQLFVPEFNSGAMENAGAVTFNESMIHRSKVTDAAHQGRAGTILHEMAHMWFGDLVTMEWWDDLWLNESFATYLGTLAVSRATRWTDAWVRFAQGSKLVAMMADQLPTTHPIVGDCPDTESARMNFDGISYSKGASVLKQLVAWVGEEAFQKGIRAYIRSHEYGNAALRDFLSALEEASGRDLAAWSAEWLETAGVNTFRASIDVAGGPYRSVALEQTAAPERPTLRSHRIAVGLYDRVDGRLARRRRVELDAVGARTEVPDLSGEPAPDLLLLNDDDLTFCKLRLDERSLATLTEHLAVLEDPLARALSWTAAADQLRDAELAARDYVRLVLNNVAVETDPGPVGQLLGQAAEACARFGEPSNRDGLRLRIAQRALDEARRAAPAGDLQLVWARAFIGSARTEEHLALVRRLLDGDETIEGLSVDTDLRWAMVRRLCSTGAAGEDLIDAEVERDPTDAGRRHAISARTARPLPEAKEVAWRAIVEAPSTPLYELRAYAGGFYSWEHPELAEPFVDRYFDAIPVMWETRPFEVSVPFVRALFPSVLAGDAILARADAFLEEQTLPPPLRRSLLESADGVRRTLRCRARDARAAREE